MKKQEIEFLKRLFLELHPYEFNVLDKVEYSRWRNYESSKCVILDRDVRLQEYCNEYLIRNESGRQEWVIENNLEKINDIYSFT